eukprot:TRINITY_DN744_c0_g1_i2.p1 TRINITY_DN744_c0_g1~~TRINITY_DN744_c0_g1_i2.p1  ORF type:complete len:138 (+),score=32.39 TRINITY_DN744_c0_g1_i2:49-414(+)
MSTASKSNLQAPDATPNTTAPTDMPTKVEYSIRMPPRITFYPTNLLRYEGSGSVNARKVLLSLGLCFGAAGVLFYSSRVVGRRIGGEPPKTLSPEWKAATEEKIRAQNADPISQHKIGERV